MSSRLLPGSLIHHASTELSLTEIDLKANARALSFLLRDYAQAVEMTAGDVAVAIAPANTGATGYLFPVLAPLLCGAAAVLLWKSAKVMAQDLPGDRLGSASGSGQT